MKTWTFNFKDKEGGASIKASFELKLSVKSNLFDTFFFEKKKFAKSFNIYLFHKSFHFGSHFKKHLIKVITHFSYSNHNLIILLKIYVIFDGSPTVEINNI